MSLRSASPQSNSTIRIEMPTVDSPRNHLPHTRAAVEAFTSAVFYSECSLGGISALGAAKAEENARKNHSRWWLRGDDPNHPTLQSVRVDNNNTIIQLPLMEDDAKSSEKEQTALPPTEDNHGHIVRSLEEPVDTRDALHYIPATSQQNSNSAIFVHDDDYGMSFGSLGNFSIERTVHSAISRSTTPSSSQSSYSSQPSPTSEGRASSQHILLTSDVKTTDGYCSSSCSGISTSTASIISCTSIRSRKRHRIHDATRFDKPDIGTKIHTIKTKLLLTLQHEGISIAFKKCLATLEQYSNLRNRNGSDNANNGNIDGTWKMISPPDYPSSLGTNSHGESLFTLGRMSFDMYQPSDLICSIQKQYNTIHSVEPKDVPKYVPRSLRKEVSERRSVKYRGGLKTHNIIALFTIEQANGNCEEDKSKIPLRGIMTTYGYALPDPTHSNRKSIWFTGGTIEPAQNDSLHEWKKIFGTTTYPIIPTSSSSSSPSHPTNISSERVIDQGQDSTSSSPSNAIEDANNEQSTKFADTEKARILASKIMLGVVHEPMNSQGVIGFYLKRPIGGHGSAYCDLIYMDEDIRIMRGHSGSIYVFKKEVIE